MTSLALDWKGDLKFESSPGQPAIVLHSSTAGITSPPQALAYAVMACMGMDIVHIIQKGRHEMASMSIRFTGERATDHPRRFLSMGLHFDITGPVAPHVIERAIELSKAKYCSVWNTIREDVALTTTFAIRESVDSEI